MPSNKEVPSPNPSSKPASHDSSSPSSSKSVSHSLDDNTTKAALRAEIPSLESIIKAANQDSELHHPDQQADGHHASHERAEFIKMSDLKKFDWMGLGKILLSIAVVLKDNGMDTMQQTKALARVKNILETNPLHSDSPNSPTAHKNPSDFETR